MIEHAAQNSIAAARAAGARILFPGTVYNDGPDAFPWLEVESPQTPTTRKGVLRVQMEAKLAEAAREGVCPVIVWAGDFFGPGAGNNWLAQGMVEPGRPLLPSATPALCKRRTPGPSCPTLWDQPVLLDNSRLLSVLGEEPHTPLDQALAATLRGLSIPTAAVPALS